MQLAFLAASNYVTGFAKTLDVRTKIEIHLLLIVIPYSGFISRRKIFVDRVA